MRGLNKLLKKLRETGTMAIDEVVTLKAYRISLVFFYSVILIHELDITRRKCVFWLQIFSAATLPNMIKIDQHLNK